MSENKRIFLSKLTLDIQTGVGLETGQGSDPVVMMRFSTDSGYTWSNEQSLTIGQIGRYDWRALAFRLGWGRNWVFEFSGSDPVTLGLLNLYLEGESGEN